MTNFSRLIINGSAGHILSLLLVSFAAAANDRFEEPPFSYSTAQDNNPVSKLAAALANKTVALKYGEKLGYLKSVLDTLNVPIESQVLVFSKTSLQQQYISPTNPRAVYFNDDVYVGTVPNGQLIEISVNDPGIGAVFYMLSQRETTQPEIVRQNNDCLQCHASVLTGGFPGHIVRSLYVDDDGFPILKAGSHITTQESPLAERWGGWYVTGTHGKARHMGNAIAVETEHGAAIDMEAGANRTALDVRVDSERYLTGHSDIVALMVLEHQTRMHNLITQANFEAKFALRDQAILDEALKTPTKTLSESTQRRIANFGGKLIDYMLFVHEAKLESPIQGASGFAEMFMKQGPRDSQGRSLRDLDLETRLFKYPVSYLIYSPQFDGLPSEMKDYVYQRLWNILNGVDDMTRYSHLDEPTRRAIRQILVETKPDLPEYWKG